MEEESFRGKVSRVAPIRKTKFGEAVGFLIEDNEQWHNWLDKTVPRLSKGDVVNGTRVFSEEYSNYSVKTLVIDEKEVQEHQAGVGDFKKADQITDIDSLIAEEGIVLSKCKDTVANILGKQEEEELRPEEIAMVDTLYIQMCKKRKFGNQY